MPGPLSAAAGATMAVALRPEALRLGRAEGREVVLEATVREVHFMGSVIRVTAEVAGTRVALDTFNRADTPPPALGSRTEVSLSARDLIALD
jgi:putative spermidine/putrescine transport system ATP-binding protein